MTYAKIVKVNHAEKEATRKEQRDEIRSREKQVREKKQKELNEAIRAGDEKEAGVRDGVLEKEEERKGELVVHPWHLYGRKYKDLGDGRVVLEDKEQSGVYKIATHSDNIKGNGLFRRELGQGHIRLPRTWGDMSLVAQAARVTVGAAMGKTDLDTRALVPLVELNLKELVAPWPGVKEDILTFLTSTEYAKLVEEYHAKRVDCAFSIQRSKVYRLAANHGYTRAEAVRADRKSVV